MLQNLVTAEEECTDEKIAFWSQFVDLYYQTVGGSVSCCYSDIRNDGSNSLAGFPSKQFSNPLAAISSSSSVSSSFPAVVTDNNNLNGVSDQTNHREGNCEKYFEKINSDEWVPDILGTV